MLLLLTMRLVVVAGVAPTDNVLLRRHVFWPETQSVTNATTRLAQNTQ